MPLSTPTHARHVLIPALLLVAGHAIAGGGHDDHMQQSQHMKHESAERANSHSSMAGMEDMDHKGHDDNAFGRPGQADAVTRTIEIEAKDIRFAETKLAIKPGTTVRFVIRNTGTLPHEFVLGSADEQVEHAKAMKNMMPGMQHDDPNAVTVEAGQTAELIWQFSDKPQAIEFACHIPGHYEAGMFGMIDLS